MWSYGDSTGLAAEPLVAHPRGGKQGTAAYWDDPNNSTSCAPDLGKNYADGAAFNGTFPGKCWSHPGPHGEYSTFRFTAPSSGTYRIDVQFFAGDGGETDGAVLRGTEVLFEHTTSSNPTYSDSLELDAGETIDAAVGITGSETFY